ncbi:MAG: hypothetical protein ACK4RK_21385 [Gemmataceae bacterium]
MSHHEYLIHYGNAGDLGQFHCDETLTYQRGERVVVRTVWGVTLGVVLCPLSPAATAFPDKPASGELLGRADAAADAQAEATRQLGQRLYAAAEGLIAEWNLPLVLLDVDVSLDGQQATLHVLNREPFEEQMLVDALSPRFVPRLWLRNLVVAEVASGCGRPDCGHEAGGCSTCASGGCSSCGAGKADEVAAYFTSLRQRLATAPRVPLL